VLPRRAQLDERRGRCSARFSRRLFLSDVSFDFAKNVCALRHEIGNFEAVVRTIELETTSVHQQHNQSGLRPDPPKVCTFNCLFSWKRFVLSQPQGPN
jgi:hypothetical protein